ncbi:uncharacterized protein OCT59_024033 [Rhizophagus irregularis]|uniref:uncharacterized protein n=1 Tax=Rhizophagus irregularis TaxID=588596 RepID=UPI00331C0895|nr:hypothetical protein OCT59_024033 [Rhizophagus irregularis]
MDNFIFEKKLKWIPYDKFKNVEYLDKGRFGTIYKATWFYDNKDNEVILKLHNNLSENLNEFLNEWKYHGSCLSSYYIIYFYGFTKDPDTLKYMVVMDYANEGERPEIIENTPQHYVELMKKCWDENPLKRPSSKEVLNIIENWIAPPYNVEDINEELKYNIMEFINAPIGHNNNLATISHSQAYYTSRLLDFTSKELNEILESRNLQAYYLSQSSTSGKVNEILESEDSQANVKVNEMLVSKDLDDCIFNLKSLDIKPDKK